MRWKEARQAKRIRQERRKHSMDNSACPKCFARRRQGGQFFLRKRRR